jgi:hypothetical protein
VRTHFAGHSLGHRIVVIIAACVVALATTVASFAAARIAAEGIADPLGIICHTEGTGGPSRSGDDGNVVHCINNCSVCCLMAAALPPPPPVLHRTVLPLAVGLPFAAPVVATHLGSKSHRSRAPPQTV